MNQTPVLSVITVCFQARDQVQATLTNLLEQTWTDFEYLVIDGGSGDGTKALLDGATPAFSQAGIPFCFLSEPDQGIYDAMNKGVRMAAGTWLLFLNAGDLLLDPEVLARTFKTPPEAKILYGDTLCIYQGQKKLYPALPLSHLTYEMAFCHQSAFIRRELLLEHPYDITYRVCADHHFFLSMYLQQISFARLPFPVSVYEIAGYSDQHKLRSHREQHRMQKELGVFRPTLSWFFREIRFYLKQGIKHIFGQHLIDLVRKKRLHER